MAKAVTLAQLLLDCRLYADARPGGASAFITDTELTRLVNIELAAIYDRLVAAGGHEYYLNQSTINTIAGTASYAFGAGWAASTATFYRLAYLRIGWSATDTEDITDCQIAEQSALRAYTSWGRYSPKGFRIAGDNLMLYPTPTAVCQLQMGWVPCFTDLAGAASFDGVNGWEEALICGVAAKICMIQQKDPGVLWRLRDEALQRIDSMAADRTANHPKRIVDVQPEGARAFQREILPRA